MSRQSVRVTLALAPGLVLVALAAAWAGGLGFGEDLSGLPLEERFRRGTDWGTFVAELGDREEAWRTVYDGADAAVAPVLQEVRSLGGPWRLLVVSESWCGDSRNSVPYLARLAEAAGNVELRLVSKADAPDLLAAHPMEDGRAAIPLVLVLDADYAVRGAWVERPAPLRALIAEERAQGRSDGVVEKMRAWHADDRGRTGVAEVVALLRTPMTE